MNEQEIKNIIKTNIEKKNAPGLLRLAFHDSGTFCPKTRDGGVSGSITNACELAREENDGLQKSADLIAKLKTKLLNISVPDIIAIAGAVAVEICGGPIINVTLGRKENLEVAPEARLPDENDGADQLKQTFGRMGFTAKELVTLSGAHTLGDARDKAFTDDRLTFNNSYFKNLINKDLPAHLGRFKSDEALTEATDLRQHVEQYAKDEELFFKDFKDVYIKMSQLGFS